MSAEHKTSYDLVYYPGRGRGEVIRLIFAAAGAAYKDDRFEGEDEIPPAIKAEAPYGQVPFLRVHNHRDGNFIVSQHGAIARFLSSELGLAPKTARGVALVDQTFEQVEDLHKAYKRWQFADDVVKASTFEALKTAITEFVPLLEKQRAGRAFLTGDAVSIADLYAIRLFEDVLKVDGIAPLVSDSFKAFLESVRALPRVAHWIETRPKSDW